MALHPQMKTWNGFGVTCTPWHAWPCRPSAVTAPTEMNASRLALRLVPPHDREDLEERAAVREYDGGLDRDAAERAVLMDYVREARSRRP